jgi:hypothetical protein
MLNGLNPWGNGHLMPHGPLREPLLALERADVAVVHHVDLVCLQVYTCFFPFFLVMTIEVSGFGSCRLLNKASEILRT